MADPEAMSKPWQALAIAGKQVGDKYLDIFADMQSKIDATETLKAIDDFRNEQRNYINGQLNIVGKNVIDVSDLTQNEADKGKDLTTRATEWHKIMADTYANNLSNDNQRDLFYKLASKEIDSGINKVALHQAEQTRQYFTDQIEYSIDTAIKDIQENPSEDTVNRAKLKVATVVQAIYPGQNVDDYKLHALNRIDTATAAIRERERKTAEIREGIDLGVEIFKQDSTGSIEVMTDAVRAQKLSPESEKVAIEQIKELYNERKTDEDNTKKAVFDSAYNVLTKKALSGNGRLNKLSDLPPEKWAEMMAVDPKTTMQIQDKISSEQRQQTRIDKQEQRLLQADNESEIMISDDFRTRDLKKDLALGKISPAQYRNLTSMQEKLDPMKRFSVKAALSKVTSGIALNKALKAKGNEAALWKLKYGDLIKAWAYKNADDPNFDDNLNKYVEKYVLSDMVTRWFASDEADRLTKYKKAKEEVGELPQGKGSGKRPDGTSKGNGWLGVLPLTFPDKSPGVATEYSVTVGIDGKDVLIPSLVPTLTKDEISQMTTDIIPNQKKVPEPILQKAVSFAKGRIKEGKSPFVEGGKYSQSDLEFTAKKHGITVDEVKKRLGVK
jgi:hypothetical protein